MDGGTGWTVERGLASHAPPSLIHSVWVSPMTPAVWVWWMRHICPPEPQRHRLGGPRWLLVMASVLHGWHIITNTNTKNRSKDIRLTLTCQLDNDLNRQWEVVRLSRSYSLILRHGFRFPPEYNAKSSPLIFHHVHVNVAPCVIHQCNIINVHLPVRFLSYASHLRVLTL